LDNDCDGETDEQLGLGPCSTICGQGKLRCVEGDVICDAPQPEPEVCDGVDNDCNGATDDGLAPCCWPVGATRPCGSAVGACQQGVQTCAGDEGWGPCEGQVEPTVEVCNGEDDDCDGALDNVAAQGTPCGSDQGECSPGVYSCVNGIESCEGERSPGPEVCDGLDNDCDGSTDQGNPGGGQACGSNVGACQPGVLACEGGALRCVGQVAPGAELCDGADNDCDGATDEDPDDVGEQCPSGRPGRCAAGRLRCAEGNLVCLPEQEPRPEVCNGEDDDCNGEVDDGTGRGEPCTVGRGACQREGRLVCTADGQGTVCDAQPGEPSAELCGTGVDEDCDGDLDEGFSLGEACAVGLGLCRRQGQTVCGPDGLDTACGAVPGDATAELCGTGADEDCDGEVDEGFPVGVVCARGEGACRREGMVVCTEDRLGVECSVQAGVAVEELCGNGADDDCDGEVDEGFPLGELCVVGRGECERRGALVCGPEGAGTVCGVQAGEPGAELCGTERDEDCDGEVDEGFDVGDLCAVGRGECTRQGAMVCAPGGLATVCSAQAAEAGVELCGTDLDEDCDGEVDEGFDAGAECVVGLGLCQRIGKLECTPDGLSTECNVEPGEPGVELCGTGLDEDCDGEVDEGFGAGEPCTRGRGECLREGALRCSPDGLDAQCDAPAIAPGVELCGTGLDEDCDGDVDEGFALGQPCDVGRGECKRSGELVCTADLQGVTCDVEPGLPEAELCDGLDNDCDGEADEELVDCADECGPDPFDRTCTEAGSLCIAWDGADGLHRCSEVCDRQEDCAAGLACTVSLPSDRHTTGFGVCLPPAEGAAVPAGEFCASDDQCLTNHCINRVCRAVCSSDGWLDPEHDGCPQGEVCAVFGLPNGTANGFCLPEDVTPGGGVGAPCGNFADCQSGLCDPINRVCLPPCQTHWDCNDVNQPFGNEQYCGIVTQPDTADPIVLACFSNPFAGWLGPLADNMGAPCSVQSEWECFRGWCFHYDGWQTPDRCSDTCVEDADCGPRFRCVLAELNRSGFPPALVRVCDHPDW